MTTQASTAVIADSAVTTTKLAANAVTTAKITDANVTTPKIADANVTPQKLSQPLTSPAQIATTSGTTVDLNTAIPSWVKRITIGLNGVSLSGSSNILIQIGSTTYSTSGYVGGAAQCGASPTQTTQTAGLQCGILSLNTLSATGHAILTNITGNTWLLSFYGSRQTDGYGLLGSSVVTLGGALDRVRLASANGTDTFDAGAAHIQYE